MNTHMKTCYGVSRNDRNELVATQFAANVQKIYALYLFGRSLRDICKSLQEACIYSPSGKSEWTPRAIENVLSNATYINMVISEDTFNQVRAEQARRSNATTTEHGTIRKATRYNSKNVLSGLLVCQECGRAYRRITKHDGSVIWRCANRVEHGSKLCKKSPSISEELIQMTIAKHLSASYTEDAIRQNIRRITVHSSGFLEV